MNEIIEMENGNKEKALVNGNVVSEMLMKPFELGWTREVVRRVIVKNGAPTCDIYYYSPGGKKIRSKIEAKSFLTDGLTPDCFNFKKKEILGLDSKFETVRDARVRKKGTGKPVKPTNSTITSKTNKNEEKKTDDNEEESKNEEKKEEEDSEAKAVERIHEKTDSGRPQRVKKKKTEEEEKSEKSTNRTAKKKIEMVKKRFSERIKPAAKRKSVLKKIMEAKQLKRSKSVLPKIKSKKGSSKNKINVKSKKLKKVVDKKLKKQNKSTMNSKSESSKMKSNSESDKKSSTSDLKSIVKKNIGKYREMREKQKLGVIKSQNKKQSKKMLVNNIIRPRSESIAKNKHFYLKPFEKGWRRELVFRSNSGDKSRQLADVYYFHPNGKKLRSFREISENLTPGLTIDCFTFKKESLECGEPAEVVRNARTFYKN